jgi:hypothetical protein
MYAYSTSIDMQVNASEAYPSDAMRMVSTRRSCIARLGRTWYIVQSLDLAHRSRGCHIDLQEPKGF